MSLRAWRQNPVAHHLFTLDQHIPGVDSETVSSKTRRLHGRCAGRELRFDHAGRTLLNMDVVAGTLSANGPQPPRRIGIF